MRVAVVDGLFSWPPHGGADVDLYHTVQGLQQLGHEVHLFGAKIEPARERSGFDPYRLPFPATRLSVPERAVNRRDLPAAFRDAVKAWRPEVVFLGFGYFLKPYVAEALSDYPMVSRYYAYELVCPRDFLLFKDGAPCPMNYLYTPDVCRPCALAGMRREIQSWRFLSWTREYMRALAFLPGYHARVIRTLRQFKAIVVYNQMQKRQLEPLNPNVFVVPGGVDIENYPHRPAPVSDAHARKVVLMTGRAEDPIKGLQTLREAGERLARQRRDFEIRATHPDASENTDWLKGIGWHSPSSLKELYAAADICVAPSLWEEPFGLVAVEAMASGRPVCASRVGGLQDIVVHGETGFLFDRGDSSTLADSLARLLDDAGLRKRMGEAGRKRAEREYDWRRIAAVHYPLLLEACLR